MKRAVDTPAHAVAAGAQDHVAPGLHAGSVGWSKPLDLAVGGALAILALALYVHSRPAVVNPDGLGYLKQMTHNYAAGHLLYLPLLRAVTVLYHGDALRAGLAISAAAGTAAVALCFACARALAGRREAALAAAGLMVSYGAWVQGADVEVYACALAAVLTLFALALAYRRRPSLPGAAATGVALGVSVLFHLTHVLATPFAVVLVALAAPSRRRAISDGAIVVLCGGSLALAGYAFAAFHVRHLDTAGALRWVMTAGHGFPYGGDPLARGADAVYGLSRALVWSPYLYESNAQVLLGHFLLGLAAAALLVGTAIAGRRALATLPRLPLLLWVAPYATMALAFFGSDHERWVFLLPPLWIAGAAGACRLRRGAACCALAVALLFLVNRASAIVPAQTETWPRTRADAAASVMRDGDMVIFPGHSWDEYVGFYTRTHLEPFPLAYYAGVFGADGCVRRMEKVMAIVRAQGGRVFAVRLLDEGDPDTRGFYELGQLGLPRPMLVDLLRRFRVTPLPTREPKVTVWLLDGPAPSP